MTIKKQCQKMVTRHVGLNTTVGNCKLKPYTTKDGLWCLTHDPEKIARDRERRIRNDKERMRLNSLARKINGFDRTILDKVYRQIQLYKTVDEIIKVINKAKLKKRSI